MKLIQWGTIACMAAMAVARVVVAADAGSVPLDRAADLINHHRYQEVTTLLAPFASRTDLDANARFWVVTDLGVSAFHLAQYGRAYDLLKQAAGIEPRNAQVALYREAAAWVTGRKQEALEIFDGILSSGAKNLFPAVTLPGERQFMADPETWAILLRHAIALEANLKAGTFAGIGLGSSRAEVATIFHLGTAGDTRPVLQAAAGPRILWAFTFNASGRVSEILIDAQNVLRYSPYVVALDRAHDWKTTAASAIGLLGHPASTRTGKGGAFILRWNYPDHFAELEFDRPDDPPPPMVPPGTAIFRMIRIKAVPPGSSPSTSSGGTP